MVWLVHRCALGWAQYIVTQHNATDVASFEGACNWHAQDQCLDPGEDDALDWRVRQRVPVPANIQQFCTAIEKEWVDIPQAPINSMRKRCVTPDTDISDPWELPPHPTEIKLHILEWLFIVTSPRHICVLIIPFNQHPDMPHLSGGWIVLAKEKCALTQI